MEKSGFWGALRRGRRGKAAGSPKEVFMIGARRRTKLLQLFLQILLLFAAAGLLAAGLLVESGRLGAPAWSRIVCYAASAAVFVLWVWLVLFFSRGREGAGTRRRSLWSRIFLSDSLAGKSKSHAVAYIGVTTALCIAVNLFEFRFADVQFSLTVFASVLSGMLVGPVFGFIAVFLGDAIGFLGNPAGSLYMPWVGLSVATMSAIAGLVMNFPLHFKGSGYVKLALICVLTLAVCSVGINTTGMYFYYTRIGFSAKSLALLKEHFGGANTYFTYALVRLLFMGQLWNSLFNYALLFAAFPLLRAAKPLGLKLD